MQPEGDEALVMIASSVSIRSTADFGR